MEKTLIGKKEIMDRLGFKSDRALKFLRMAKVQGYGIQIGRFYYIEKDKLDKMLADFAGLQLLL